MQARKPNISITFLYIVESYYSIKNTEFMSDCCLRVVVVVVPMAEMVEKLSHHCSGILVEFMLRIPVPPELSLT
jgi:hypothetical protein